MSEEPSAGVPTSDPAVEPNLVEALQPLLAQWKLLIGGPLLAGALALGGTYLIAPTFTAVTNFLPPQQAQSSASAALAALGPLAGLAGGVGSARANADQYVALMESVSVSDRIIDAFGLMEVYEAKFRIDARLSLGRNVRIAASRKHGLISVEVDDKDPERAAAIANRYVEELRRLTSQLALTEAQQRRAFFEAQLAKSRERLVFAQTTLQSSGFNPGALKAEPKAAAEAFARLKAEATATEVRLQTLRGALTETTPEVRQQAAALAALREQLARAAQSNEAGEGSDYIGSYREFKYQEALFEMYARQFELARVDESREGTLIQVVDPATPPERKSGPKRLRAAIWAGLCAALLLSVFFMGRAALQRERASPRVRFDGNSI